VFRRTLHKSGVFVAALSAVLAISAVYAGVILEAIPMPTEVVYIRAVGDGEVAIQSMVVDGKKYVIEEPVEGNWYYSKEVAAYMWVGKKDPRLIEPISAEIAIRIPVGAGRKLTFLCGENSGSFTVTYCKESRDFTLQNIEAESQNISIPDSNAVWDNCVKLLRLAFYGFMVICALALTLFLLKIMSKKSLINLFCIISSIISTLTFYLNLSYGKYNSGGVYQLVVSFLRSFSAGNYVLAIILMPMLYKVYAYCLSIYQKDFMSAKSTICIAVPSSLFAAFMVIGAAFYSENTLRPVFGNELQVAKSMFGFLGYFSIFFFGIVWVFHLLDHVDISKVSNQKHLKPIQLYISFLQERPFVTSFITIFVLYIPYIVATYPGIFMADAKNQMDQIYGITTLSNAHPIVHTLFMGVCIKFGEFIFGSSNIGLFICSMLQFLFINATVSLIVKLLFSIHVSAKVSLLLIFYYAFHPRIRYWMFLMTKDIINATFLLVFIACLYLIFTKQQNIHAIAALGVSDLGAMLFRNDSQYVVVISLIILLFMTKNLKKLFAIVATCSLTFAIVWNSALLPLLNIPPNRPWHNKNIGLLSGMMIQQTARYLRDAGDEVTAEEREIISACFDYEQIVPLYEPDNKVDGIYYNVLKHSTITADEWAAYEALWFKMFLKHPAIYFEATLNHKYQYLYPCVYTTYYYSYPTSAGNMDGVNSSIATVRQEFPSKFAYPDSLETFRGVCQSLREFFFRLPVFNILNTTSSYFWILFIWLSYCILRKKKTAIAIMMPLLILLLVLIAGPCNGMYFRYTYPYALCLPVVIVLGLKSKKVGTEIL